MRLQDIKLQTIWKETRIFVFCFVATLAGVTVGSGGWPVHPPNVAPVAAATAVAPATPGSVETSFAPVVERALPAVVNISSSKASKVRTEAFEMDPFFRQFFGDQFGNQFGRRGFRQPRNQVEQIGRAHV